MHTEPRPLTADEAGKLAHCAATLLRQSAPQMQGIGVEIRAALTSAGHYDAVDRHCPYRNIAAAAVR